MANLNDLKSKRVGIFGYGTEGQSLLRYLLKLGCKNIKVFDESLSDVEIQNDAELIIGKFEDNNYDDLDIVFRSPGTQYLRLESLLPSKVEISSPTNLFFENCRGKTIGITGTKGKSTTALLVAQILRNNNKKVFVVGNIGDPMLDVVDQATEKSYCVIELSSFQLQDLKTKPDVAIILPILSDHLDYHKDEDEYIAAKNNIVSNKQQTIIVDLETLAKLSIPTESMVISYSDIDVSANFNFKNDDFLGAINGREFSVSNVTQFARDRKIPQTDLLASFAYSCSEGLSFELDKFDDFKKLPLRVELVSTKDGVEFFNDSASTNPISTSKAMEMMKGDYFLIMGGSAKGVSFDNLAKQISDDSKIKKVFLFGATAKMIADVILESGYKQIEIFDSLEDVFIKLTAQYRNVSAVLFSPACASFDQYKNYKERGEKFNLLVNQINE